MRDDRNAVFIEGLSKGLYYKEGMVQDFTAEKDEAVSWGTWLFPELSDNISIVGYCGKGFKYYKVTSCTGSKVCVCSQTDTNPPTEGRWVRQTVIWGELLFIFYLLFILFL